MHAMHRNAKATSSRGRRGSLISDKLSRRDVLFLGTGACGSFEPTDAARLGCVGAVPEVERVVLMRDFIPPPRSIRAEASVDIAAPPHLVAARYCDVERWGETAYVLDPLREAVEKPHSRPTTS